VAARTIVKNLEMTTSNRIPLLTPQGHLEWVTAEVNDWIAKRTAGVPVEFDEETECLRPAVLGRLSLPVAARKGNGA